MVQEGLIMEIHSREELYRLPYYLTEDMRKRYLNIINDYWWEVYDEYGRMVEEHYGNSYEYIKYNDYKYYKTIISFEQETSQESKTCWKYCPWDYINPKIDRFDNEKIFEYCKKYPKLEPYKKSRS